MSKIVSRQATYNRSLTEGFSIATSVFGSSGLPTGKTTTQSPNSRAQISRTPQQKTCNTSRLASVRQNYLDPKSMYEIRPFRFCLEILGHTFGVQVGSLQGPAQICSNSHLLLRGPHFFPGDQAARGLGACSRAMLKLDMGLNMNGCQNYGPFLGPIIIRHLIFRGPKRGP